MRKVSRPRPSDLVSAVISRSTRPKTLGVYFEGQMLIPFWSHDLRIYVKQRPNNKLVAQRPKGLHDSAV